MYREETEYAVNFYEYIGMVENSDFMTEIYLLGSDNNGIINKITEQARIFKDRILEYARGDYQLQLLEQSVIILMPYASKYKRKDDPSLLLVFGFGIKGIHYFKRID